MNLYMFSRYINVHHFGSHIKGVNDAPTLQIRLPILLLFMTERD
jgi:hypothetical protein